MAMHTQDHRTATLPAADCHVHIIDHACFPFPGNCGYTPCFEESGTFEELSFCLREHGITHGMAVYLSGWGYDNAATLDALTGSGGRLKGIAMAPVDSSSYECNGRF